MTSSERQVMLEVYVQVIKRFMRSDFKTIVPVKVDLQGSIGAVGELVAPAGEDVARIRCDSVVIRLLERQLVAKHFIDSLSPAGPKKIALNCHGIARREGPVGSKSAVRHVPAVGGRAPSVGRREVAAVRVVAE